MLSGCCVHIVPCMCIVQAQPVIQQSCWTMLAFPGRPASAALWLPLLPFPQAAALRKQGITLAVDSNAALDGAQLLAAVAAAERERAATAADAPLGEWEVLKVRDLDAGGDRGQ